MAGLRAPQVDVFESSGGDVFAKRGYKANIKPLTGSHEDGRQ